MGHDHEKEKDREDALDLDELLLSRYQDGEVTDEERRTVEARLAQVDGLKQSQNELDELKALVRKQHAADRALHESPDASSQRTRRFAETLDALAAEAPASAAEAAPSSRAPDTAVRALPARAVSMSYWQQVRGVLITAAAAIMLLVGWWVVQENDRDGLAAYAERIRDVAGTEILRQYKISFEPKLLKKPDDWPADKPWGPLEPFGGALYTMGGERFLLRHRLPARGDRPEDELTLGGHGQKRWLSTAQSRQWVEVESTNALPRQFSKTDLYYMELDAIVGQLDEAYEIVEADLSEEDRRALEDEEGVAPEGALRRVLFKAVDPDAALNTIEIIADEAAEIHEMTLHVLRRERFQMTIRLKRTPTDADPASIFEPETHLAPDAEKVDVEKFFEHRFGGRHRKAKAGAPSATAPTAPRD